MAIDGLIKIIAMTMAQARARNIAAAAGRIAGAVLCAGFMMMFFVAALGCGVAALWIYALPVVGPVAAPLVAAGALLVACLILMAIARGLLSRKRSASGSAAVPELILAEVTRLFKEHKGSVLLAAFIAGLVAANGSRAR